MNKPKSYFRPKTLDEARNIAAQQLRVALVCGTMTPDKINFPYEIIIDLQDIPELSVIESHERGWDVGALCTLQQVIDIPGLPDIVRRSLAHSVPTNLLNLTSVGESFLSQDKFLEWRSALSVLIDDPHEGLSLISSHDSALRKLSSAPEIFKGLGHRSGRVIVELYIPRGYPGTVMGAACVPHTLSDEPIVNVAACVTVDERRKVLGGDVCIGGATSSPLERIPLDELNLQHFDETFVDDAVEVVSSAFNPIKDDRSSAEYRAEMAQICLRQALIECLEQLK